MTLSQLFARCSEPWKPHSYQKVGVKFLLEHACAGIFADPGLGKTSITLAAITFLKKRKMINKVLIVAPVRVCHNVWPKEIQRWSDFKHLTCTVLHGPHKDQLLKQETDIHLINPEGLDWLLGFEKTRSTRTNKVKIDVDVARFKKLGYDVLVIDELNKFKHYNSNRSKGFKLVLHTFGRRWGLTGSPAANGLMDLFGQIYMLDLGNALGRFITHFRSQFFVPDRNGFAYELQPGGEERIYEKIEPIVIRMGDDLIDMPDLVPHDVMVQLPDKARKIYDELEKELIVAVEDRLVTAANAGIVSMKCRQVCCGGIYLDPKTLDNGLQAPKSEREWVNLHEAKTDAMLDLVDELQGEPLLVAYDFQHDQDRLRKAFPKAVFACDFPAKKFSQIEDKWNAGKIPLLFGHPASIGHGLNLQGAGHHVAWHSPTWDYDLYDQFIRRVYRQGNKHKRVFNHRLIVSDSIEEVIYMAIEQKSTGQQSLFKALIDLASSRKKVRK